MIVTKLYTSYNAFDDFEAEILEAIEQKDNPASRHTRRPWPVLELEVMRDFFVEFTKVLTDLKRRHVPAEFRVPTRYPIAFELRPRRHSVHVFNLELGAKYPENQKLSTEDQLDFYVKLQWNLSKVTPDIAYFLTTYQVTPECAGGDFSRPYDLSWVRRYSMRRGRTFKLFAAYVSGLLIDFLDADSL